jgi:hypothetical protein
VGKISRECDTVHDISASRVDGFNLLTGAASSGI